MLCLRVPSLKISHLPSLLSSLLLILPLIWSNSFHILSSEAWRRSVRAVKAPPQVQARHPPVPRAPPTRSSSAPLPPGSCVRPHYPRPAPGLQRGLCFQNCAPKKQSQLTQTAAAAKRANSTSREARDFAPREKLGSLAPRVRKVWEGPKALSPAHRSRKPAFPPGAA